MEILNKKQKIIIGIIAILAIFFIAYYIINKASDSEYIDLEIAENYEVEEDNTKLEEEYIIVHITGAVAEEGIVKIEKGSRISDAIEAAGGITEEADLSKINLAYSIKDGQKIYVPNVYDDETVEYVSEEAGDNVIEGEKSESGKVNINTATQTELETLNGIGPSTALKIIDYRNENGKFEKIEDITNVPGIGEAKFENIKESICVE